ncbi:MAG: SDR family NAD(P)-dependent oxidoreductase, partial [Gemmatimonadales bacterium]
DLRAPSLPLVSNLTGTWLTHRDATDPEYWVRQLRETVRFSDGLRELLATPDRVLLEVGPGRTLATLARIHPDRDGAQETFTSLRHPDDEVDDQAFMLRVLGELWQRGVEVDWSALHGEPRRRIPLPTYPFEHERHLVETGPLPSTHAMALVTERDTAPGAKAREGAPALGETPGEGPETAPHQWLHRVRWADVAGAAPCSPAGASDSTPPGRTLLVVPRGRGEGPAFRRLQEELEGEVTVHSGPPSTREAWLQLLDAREPSGGNDGDGFVRQVLHAGYMERGSAEEGGVSDLIALGQALLELDPGERPELVVLTCRAHALEEAEGDAVEGAVAEKHLEGGDPAGALLAGPVRVLPAEVPGLRVRWVDLGAPDEPLPAHLLRSRDMPAVMAVRDGKILTPTFEAVPPEYGPGSPRTPEAGDAAGRRPSAQLPESPVVLITGGTGGVGLEVARHLVRTRNARVALLARTPLPEEFAEGEGTDPRQLRARRIVDELRAEGGQVRVLVADVADRDALVRAREEIREAFGEVDLLVHAAGRLDDGRIGDRERSRTEAVLRPKVAGTRALMEVFRDPAPARVVLFSSISAEAGLPGQVDYAAANAFLDAVAEHGSAGSGGCSGKGEGSGNDSSTADGTASSGPGWGASGTRLRSVGWSAWSETGMAADRARGLVHWPPHGADGDGDWHEARDPRFDVVEPASGRVRVRLREGRSWVLDEHQTRDGLPLVPGAGFVSLLHGAARELGREGDALRLEELYFLAPFVVPGGETREMELRLPTDGPGPVAVVGRSDPGEPWTEHVQGRIAAPPEDSGDGEPLSTPEDVPEWEGTGGALRQDLQLGPRWDNAARIRHAPGSQEVFLELELPEAVRGDVGHDPLHPGLLDNGTALAGPLLPGFGQEGHVHVPASFGTLEVLRPLPSRVLSRIRLSPEQDGESEDLAVLDVDLVDDRGQICVRARQFMMVRVPAQEMERLGEEAREGAEHRRMALSAALEDGLPTEVGLAILDRVLDDGSLPARVLVSPGPVEERIRDLRAAAGAGAGGAGPEAEGPDVDVAPVEAALLELEAVREAAVTAHEDRPGDVRLVAHVVMDPEVFQTVSEMRRSLARVLPREMVPRNFVELEALPRAADGSVARRRLEDPFAPQDDHVGPATPMQEVVARIWQELLGAERIGIHDNFLDVGGHSLLAMRAILRLEKETGVRLGPVEINMYTLEQIAAHLEAQGGAAPRGAGEVEGEGRGETPVEGQAGNGDEGSGGDGFLSRVRRLIPGGGS